MIDQDAAVDIRALQASVGPDQIALLIWDADSQEVARQVGEFIAKRKLEIVGVSPVVVYAIARANHDRMPPSVQQGMDQFESKLVEIVTGKTPQEVQEAQDARLAQAEYANRLALNDEKTRLAQEVYGTGAHTTYDGYVLDPRGSFYLSEFGTFVQITDQLTRALVLPEDALTPNDLSNFQEGYRLHSVATGEVPMGILRARLEELQARGELYRLSDTPHDPQTIITPELFDQILVRETREMIAVWGGDPQALRPGVALPMPGKYYPANEQVHYAQRVITHNRSAGVTDEVEQLLYAVSVVEFLTRVQEQFPGLAAEEMAQLAIILKEHPSVQLANLHDVEHVRGVIQQYLPSVNHGPAAGGEAYHNTINALMTDPTMQYLMRDTAGYMIVSRLIQDLLEGGATDSSTIAATIKDTYTAQYASQIRSASARPHEEGVQYLVDILKIDPQVAAALLDRATSSADLNSLAREAMQSQVDRYTQTKGSIHKSENMGPAGGGAEDEVARILQQMTDPVVAMFIQTNPVAAREIVQQYSFEPTSAIQNKLYEAYINRIEVGIMTAGSEEEILAFLRTQTTIRESTLQAYRTALLSAQNNPDVIARTIAISMPAYDAVADVVYINRDLMARLNPEILLENELTGNLSPLEVLRTTYLATSDHITIIALNAMDGEPIPPDVQKTYDMLLEILGPTSLNNFIQLYGPQIEGSNVPSYSDLIAIAGDKYRAQLAAHLEAPITSNYTPEQAFEKMKQEILDPVAQMYMSTHPDAARQLIYIALVEQQLDTQTIANSLVTESSLTLRREAQAADTHEEQLAAIQRQSAHDVTAYETELLLALAKGQYTSVLELLAIDVAEYSSIRQEVEAHEGALRRIDIATYDQMAAESYNSSEAIRRTYDVIESRIKEGADNYLDANTLGDDPTIIATYRNLAALAGEANINAWLEGQREMSNANFEDRAEVMMLINQAYEAFLLTRDWQNPRSTPLTPTEPDAPENLNRVDDAGAGSESAGEGNGVEVQAGDTLTQPLVEPDRRGDNAVEVPPSGYTNPSDYNPQGTPITPEGQDAMSEPMVTPDMSDAMAMSDGPIVAATAQPGATLPDGSASLGDAVRESQGETANQPPLTMDQVMKIIAEDGPAIEAYIQSERGKFGPDTLAQQLQLHEYIQANPDEVHRIIAKYMPSESTDTYWVWEEIDPATRDAIVKALLVTAAAAAAAGAAVGNTLSGGGA